MIRLLPLFLLPLAAPHVGAAENLASRFCRQWGPLHQCVSGQTKSFQVSVDLEVPLDGETQSVGLELVRYDDAAFDFAATHEDYSFRILRRAETTVLELPHHRKRFIGKGKISTPDHLAARGILSRLVDGDSSLAPYLPMLQTPPESLAFLLQAFAAPARDEKTETWTLPDLFQVRFADPEEKAWKTELSGEDWTCKLTLKAAPEIAPLNQDDDSWTVEKIDRDDLERQLCRGVRRALAILSPSRRLTAPKPNERQVEHGALKSIEGHRVALLWGTPEEIGRAHAQLLARQATRCRDSVLYTFGTVQTIRTGRWFEHDLEEAHARLAAHIPDEHRRELVALADELGWEPDLAQKLNIFPELFHCSGFALFDSATEDGTLYHGRVLDYMTTIGLQDSSVTFIVAPEGKIPFANVGYGGFTGSVTGMNAEGISLGEMGGRGEGEWDGVPMATLMRLALENCRTLEDVKSLWRTSPRTCEYYYVFADGKTNEAVGVAATPESIEFIEPGQAHPRLGEGISDAVILSAGSRLETLRERVREKHGRIDEKTALWLMSRPVAMKSNLHNALFVPAKGYLHVANATHKRPAAEQPYVKIDLNGLLEKIRVLRDADVASGGEE